jgi:glycosyltransferase involved in cell wall biosynthesis
MKILIVHEIDYLQKVIYEIHEFPEMLARAGHDVTFFQFQEGADRRKNNLFRERQIHGRVLPNSKITLVGPHQFGLASLDRLWATISCVPALWGMFRNTKFDVVLNFAVPTYGLQVLLLAKLFGVPVVHRALDVSHEIRESIYRLPILMVEKVLYRTVDLLSVNSAAMRRYCNELSGRVKPTVINYPPLDLNHFVGGGHQEQLRESLGISSSESIIVYMGSFFYFSGLPQVVREFASFIGSYPSVKLVLIGGGEQDEELRQLVDALSIRDRVLFTGFVSYKDLPRYLDLADVAINPLEIRQVASAAFPHKVLQYLAMGLPVVSTRLDGLVGALGGIEGLHWAKSPESCIGIALKLIATSKVQQNSKSNRAVLQKLFDPGVALSSLVNTLNSAKRPTKTK